MNNYSRCIITATSNKFVPSLLNMLGSLESNYVNHPDIYVYDLGISPFFIKEIEKFDKVTVLKVPHFTKFWRSCYTWKTYILNTPLADLNFYIDAGCQIVRPLDEIFKKIEDNGYLLVSQGKDVIVKDIAPKDYFELLEIDTAKINHEVIAAGIFGFSKKSAIIKTVTEKLYNAGLSGLCLGFSEKDQWKNKGVNKNVFVRDCKLFRHDTTLLTLLVIKYIEQPIIEPLDLFAGQKTDSKEQYLINMRMNYKSLEYLYNKKLSAASRLVLLIFIKLKNLRLWIKLKK